MTRVKPGSPGDLPGTPPVVRLRSGVRLTVIRDAGDGWVVESAARLLPGSVVDVVLARGGREVASRAVVARSQVVAIDRRGILYQSQLEALEEPRAVTGTIFPADGNKLPARHGHFVPSGPK